MIFWACPHDLRCCFYLRLCTNEQHNSSSYSIWGHVSNDAVCFDRYTATPVVQSHNSLFFCLKFSPRNKWYNEHNKTIVWMNRCRWDCPPDSPPLLFPHSPLLLSFQACLLLLTLGPWSHSGGGFSQLSCEEQNVTTCLEQNGLYHNVFCLARTDRVELSTGWDTMSVQTAMLSSCPRPPQVDGSHLIYRVDSFHINELCRSL